MKAGKRVKVADETHLCFRKYCEERGRYELSWVNAEGLRMARYLCWQHLKPDEKQHFKARQEAFD